jgi:exopolysaccharide biosynthesis polyprenyl glycosylphosphotransferase
MSSYRKDSFATEVLQIVDAVLIWVAFTMATELSGFVRSTLNMLVDKQQLAADMRWILYFVVPLTPLLLERFHFYQRGREKSIWHAIKEAFQALIVIVLIVSLIGMFAKLGNPPRLIFGIGLVFTFVGLLLRDRALHWRDQKRNNNYSRKERVMIAGSPEEIEVFLTKIDTEVSSRWNVECHYDLRTQDVNDLHELLKEKAIQRVIFLARHAEFEKVAAAVEACELQGVEAWISASFIKTQIARPTFDFLGSKPMLVFRSTPELSWELLCKEVMDRVGATIILILSLPFWIYAYIGIRLASPGAPVFFSQMRAGRYGSPFRLWKFRTMHADAENQLDVVKQSVGNQMDGPVFKLDRDPRIFPFGSLLRKLSIDELPQLLNVIKGDMSLVGPRPLPLYEIDAITNLSHRRRLSVKPGMTCSWQAGGRNKITSFEEWVKLDLDYIDQWSLWLDIKLLFKTIPAVLFAKGAK